MSTTSSAWSQMVLDIPRFKYNLLQNKKSNHKNLNLAEFGHYQQYNIILAMFLLYYLDIFSSIVTITVKVALKFDVSKIFTIIQSRTIDDFLN